jgi:thioredoxin reductase (NADPH)
VDDQAMNVVEATLRVALGSRFDEAFPFLSAKEIDRLRPYGAVRRYADGEIVIETGRPSPGMNVVLSGSILISGRGPLGRVTPIVQMRPGQFTAELTALGGNSAALVDGHAQGEVEALLVPPDSLRKVMVNETNLADRIMRALVLRRASLIETRDIGPLLVGPEGSPDILRLQHFLTRTGQPQHVLDPGDPVAAKLIASYAPEGAAELPLVILANGAHLQNPSEETLARELGLIGTARTCARYDVAIIGAGPAGLSTAVYAASEGLSVVLVDAAGIGGQAGESARIENYLGFPSGITGATLMGRAYAQARKFGVEVMIPACVTSLEPSAEGFLVRHGDERLCARAVVVATGARYRRPTIENLAAFEGRGVWYWASPIEARLCGAQDVIVVGGGNSAGQAAVFLADGAAKVTMMVRGPALAASMSRYLVDRISATKNIEVALRSELESLEGSRERGLERVRWRGEHGVRMAEVRHVFVFAGADPATAWLARCGVALDRSGFVVTGAGTSPLESSVPGVFAVGDVRAGSVKRVGSAIGEGAQVVAALHGFLAKERAPRRSAA